MQKLFLLCLFFLLSPTPAQAVGVALSNYPASVGDEEFSVTVTVSGASTGTNYLRLDLYQDGTTSYFGETDNGTYWYGGYDGKLYAPLLVASSSAELTLHARLGEPSASQYPGPGTYKMRIRRYTSSGNQASNDIQTPVDIVLSKAWPTPSPSPTPLPPTPPPPTPTPTPTPTPSPSLPPPSASPSPRSPLPTPLASPQDYDQVGTVAGVTGELDLAAYGVSPSPVPSPSPPGTGLTLRQDRVRPLLFIVSGLVLIVLALYLGYRQYHRGRTIEL